MTIKNKSQWKHNQKLNPKNSKVNSLLKLFRNLLHWWSNPKLKSNMVHLMSFSNMPKLKSPKNCSSELNFLLKSTKSLTTKNLPKYVCLHWSTSDHVRLWKRNLSDLLNPWFSTWRNGKMIWESNWHFWFFWTWPSSTVWLSKLSTKDKNEDSCWKFCMDLWKSRKTEDGSLLTSLSM